MDIVLIIHYLDLEEWFDADVMEFIEVKRK